nr:PREDICTED: uncharacterized protein LOC105670547 isoform X1 [Linepithema humile]
MWILCALIGLFQLIILLMLSGVLFSVAAVSRLMEVTVILIYPTVIFLLRQSANLIILLTILTARMTSSAFRKLYTLVKCDQQEVISQQEPLLEISPVQLNMQTSFLPYKRTVLEEIPKYIQHSEDEHATASSTNERIIEPLQEESQDDDLMKKSSSCKNINDCE